MTDGTLPLLGALTHSALAADAVAAAPAHCTAVPELSEGSLAARARPLAVLPAETLGPPPPQLLELQFQSPDKKEDRLEKINTRNFVS